MSSTRSKSKRKSESYDGSSRKGFTESIKEPVKKKIDLSLDIDPKPLISCEQVLPILDSIIERDNTALRSTLFPKSWRETEVGNTLLNGFNVRCLQMCDREEVVEFEFDGLKCHIVDGTPAIEI